MGDPFYVNRAEVSRNINCLTTKLQTFKAQTAAARTPAFADGADHDTLFDKTTAAPSQEIVTLIHDLEHELKDLNDTFAIQSSNCKQLGLTPQELTNRKEIVENLQRDFDELKEAFAYQVKGDPSARADTVISGFYGERATAKPRSQIERANPGFSDSSDAVYHRDSPPLQLHTLGEMEPMFPRRGPFGDFMDRHFPMTKKRNRIICYSSPVAIVVVVLLLIAVF